MAPPAGAWVEAGLAPGPGPLGRSVRSFAVFVISVSGGPAGGRVQSAIPVPVVREVRHQCSNGLYYTKPAGEARKREMWPNTLPSNLCSESKSIALGRQTKNLNRGNKDTFLKPLVEVNQAILAWSF